MQPIFPTCYVNFPEDTDHRRAPFYLAAEEYIAKELPKDNYLFSWQLSPTVVVGRNQVLHQEINLDFCRSNNIDVIRRKSGGGAIFADRNNIMWSLVTDAGAVEPLFQEYARQVAAALHTLGAEAEVSGRNDIVLKDGGKICGNSFYHQYDCNIVHGTMLYDTTPELMSGALTPNETKLQSKGVKSVSSRVALIKDYLPFGVTELRKRLQALLSDRCINLTGNDVKRIEEMEQGYYATEYLYGRTSSNIVRSGTVESCGSIALHFKLRGTLIDEVCLYGDFFELSDAGTAFNQAFKGIPFTPHSLKKAVESFHPESSIRNLNDKELWKILTAND